MKSVKLLLPARLHRELKLWLIDRGGISQTDMLCYLIDNLPPMPIFKPNSRLLNYLAVYKNQVELKKIYSTDELKMFDLIGRGIVQPTPDEQKIIDKLIGPSPK